nr:MAG TPA: hypothetical protein [Caudoviricetes sp.]
MPSLSLPPPCILMYETATILPAAISSSICATFSAGTLPIISPLTVTL